MGRKTLSDIYISLQTATRFCQYSQEYLSLRARQGKLKAVKAGRNWVIKKEWLGKYIKETKVVEAAKAAKVAKKTRAARGGQTLGVPPLAEPRSLYGLQESVQEFGQRPMAKLRVSVKPVSVQPANTDAKAAKETRILSQPPEDLPIGQFSGPIQNLFAESGDKPPCPYTIRFGFIFTFAIVLLFAGFIFGQKSIDYSFSKTSPAVSDIGKTADYLLCQAFGGVNIVFVASYKDVSSFMYGVGSSGDAIIREITSLSARFINNQKAEMDNF